MAGSLNKVILVGNLGRDPEIRHTNDGTRVANLSLATSESWKDKATGERRDRTEWHRVAIFNENLAEIAEKYLRKGSKVLVEGQLQTRKWTDQTGAEKYTTEVVLSRFKGELTMLDSRSCDSMSPPSVSSEADYGMKSSRSTPLAVGGLGESSPSHFASAPAAAPIDDEIPF